MRRAKPGTDSERRRKYAGRAGELCLPQSEGAGFRSAQQPFSPGRMPVAATGKNGSCIALGHQPVSKAGADEAPLPFVPK